MGRHKAIVIVVKPSRSTDGKKLYSTRGQLFDATAAERPEQSPIEIPILNGRMGASPYRDNHEIPVRPAAIVSRSTQPMLDAARVLLREGIDPATRLVMRHEHQSYDALHSTVSAAAKLTVHDDRTGKPIFTKWRPWDGRQSAAESPPIPQTEPSAT